jgi:metal-responsive CopG/Arc/MetJ family transcriptional regulator
MKTAISIPTPLYEAAEQLARRLGISRSELYQRAVRRFLEEYSRDIVREKLDEVYGGGEDDSRLETALEYLQSLSLEEDDW